MHPAYVSQAVTMAAGRHRDFDCYPSCKKTDMGRPELASLLCKRDTFLYTTNKTAHCTHGNILPLNYIPLR